VRRRRRSAAAVVWALGTNPHHPTGESTGLPTFGPMGPLYPHGPSPLPEGEGAGRIGKWRLWAGDDAGDYAASCRSLSDRLKAWGKAAPCT